MISLTTRELSTFSAWLPTYLEVHSAIIISSGHSSVVKRCLGALYIFYSKQDSRMGDVNVIGSSEFKTHGCTLSLPFPKAVFGSMRY